MGQAKAILHENLAIIEVADKLLMDTLLSDARAAQCILTRLSDRAALVGPGRFDALIERLRKLGHLPQVLPGQSR
jgi:hypothetical protein